MIQMFFISLLQMAVSFLEAAFTAKSFQDKDFFNDDSSRKSTNDLDVDAKLQEAYDILELTPPSTLEQVRKQWKKLSLRYHPDRNQGSEEAHKMQQKVNAAFNRIQTSMEGEETVEASSEEDSPPPDHVPDVPPPPPPEQEQEPQKQTGNRKQRRRRREENLRRRREDIRHGLEKEMQEEERKKKEHYQTLNKEKQKIRKETTRLHDHEQREAASRFFMDQVRLFRRQRRQSSNLENCVKPKHYVMESCTNDLVIAMRLGMEEFAAEILDDQINTSMQWHYNNPFFLMQAQRKHGGVTYQHLLSLSMPKVLLQRLDDDHNTLLHYAVYWERPTMVQVLCDLAKRHGLLEQIFTAENSHGHIAMDLAWVAKNPCLIPFMQTQQQVIQTHKERTRIGPALTKAVKQLWIAARDNFDAVTMMNSFLAFFVGHWVFSFHWTVAFLGVVVLQSPNSLAWILDDPISKTSRTMAPFFSLLTCTKLTLSLGCWFYRGLFDQVFSWVKWELLLLLFPVCLLCGCTGPSLALELANAALFFWNWGFMSFLYLPLHKFEQETFPRFWKALPPAVRRRPGLVQSMILGSLLLAVGLIQGKVAMKSLVRLGEDHSGK